MAVIVKTQVRCDKCGAYIEHYTYQVYTPSSTNDFVREARETSVALDWMCRLDSGKCEDICPECQEE